MSVKPTFGAWVRSYRNGFGRRPGTGETGPIVLRIADVSSGVIRLSTPRRGHVSAREGATYRLEPGDLLFVRVNGAREIVGRCCVVGEDVPNDTIFNDHLIRVQLNPGLDPEFARLCMSLPAARAVIEEAASTSAGQLTISQQVLDSIEIPDFSLDKQQLIARQFKAQLTTVEEARQAAQAQLNEIRLLKKQAFKAAFAAIEHTSLIGSVARVQSGYAFKSEAFQKQGVRLLRNANMAPGRVYWDDAVFLASEAAPAHVAYALAEGDVLISLDRPIISTGIKVARVAASDLPALLVQRVGRFRINESRLDADYLYAFLHTEPFIEAISGHEQSLGVPHISPGQIEAVEIPLPDLAEQQRLAVILNNIAEATHDAQIAAEAQLRDIELLPSRLLAEVFGTTPAQGDDE